MKAWGWQWTKRWKQRGDKQTARTKEGCYNGWISDWKWNGLLEIARNEATVMSQLEKQDWYESNGKGSWCLRVWSRMNHSFTDLLSQHKVTHPYVWPPTQHPNEARLFFAMANIFFNYWKVSLMVPVKVPHDSTLVLFQSPPGESADQPQKTNVNVTHTHSSHYL